MTTVICTVAILLSNGYRDVQQLHGTIINDDHDYWTVDFSAEFNKRHYKTDQPPVQSVDSNNCLYVNP